MTLDQFGTDFVALASDPSCPHDQGLDPESRYRDSNSLFRIDGRTVAADRTTSHRRCEPSCDCSYARQFRIESFRRADRSSPPNRVSACSDPQKFGHQRAHWLSGRPTKSIHSGDERPPNNRCNRTRNAYAADVKSFVGDDRDRKS